MGWDPTPSVAVTSHKGSPALLTVAGPLCAASFLDGMSANLAVRVRLEHVPEIVEQLRKAASDLEALMPKTAQVPT